jgi:hypothetical protein
MSAEAEDLWHVRVAPDDVKILTLEQVDDLFRLEVIDEDTMLWQDGMDEWLPLRVIAGLDDEEAPSPPPISAPPPPPPRSPALAQTAPWPPPPAASQRPLPPATLPPPPSIRPPLSRPPAPPVPPSRAPAQGSNWPSPIAATQPLSNRPSPLAATQPVSSFPAPIGSSLPRPTRPPPPGSIPVPAGAMRSQPPPSARAAVPASFAPAPSSFVPPVATPFAPRTRTSRVEVALIGLAMVAGLGVSLHRNGTLQSTLASAGQTATYENLEKSLGGPGFGTPRAVEVLVAKTPAVVEAPLVAVNTTVSPSTPAPEATPEPESKPSSPSGGRPLVAETSAPKAEKVEKRSAPVRPAAASRQAAAPAPVRKASLKKSKGGNEYDPLNPSL